MPGFRVCALLTLLVAALPEPVFAAPAESTMGETERPEVGRYGKVLKGPESEILELVRFGPAEQGEFIAKIGRIDHPLDGRVLKLKTVRAGTGLDYTFTADGDTRTLIVERTVSGSGKTYQLHLGGTQIDLQYDEPLSQEMKPEHLLTEYLEQERQEKRKRK